MTVQELFAPMFRVVLSGCLAVAWGWGLAGNASADPAAPAGKQPEAIRGAVRQVTLYREEALVTREIPVPAGKGPRVVVVDELPAQILPQSVFAEGDESVSVRAVRVESAPILDESRADIQALQDEIDQLEAEQAERQNELNIAQANLATLESVVQFAAGATRSDLERGVLDAEAVTKLTTFSRDQRTELLTEQFNLTCEITELAEEVRVVRANKARLSGGGGQIKHQARIYLETKDGAAGVVRLSYRVASCGWSPSTRSAAGRRATPSRFSTAPRFNNFPAKIGAMSN
jgi:hypothetical protein